MNKQNIMNEQKTCVFSILAIIFAFIFPLVGIVFAIIALVQISKDQSLKGKGLAIAALIISVVWIPLLMIIAIITSFGVIETDIFIPSRCTIGPVGVIDCVAYSITKDAEGNIKIYFNLANGGGKGNLKIKEVYLTGEDLRDKKCGGAVNTNYVAPGNFATPTADYLDFPQNEKVEFYVGNGDDLSLLFSGGDCSALKTIDQKVRLNIKLVYLTHDLELTHTMQGQLVEAVKEE